MTTHTNRPHGWPPIPLALKILAGLMVLWAIGTVMNLPNLMQNGLPLVGTFVFGATAASIAVFLDLFGPLVFLIALWFRKPWGPIWACFYLGLFILNGLVALIAVLEDLGAAQILVPIIAATLFLAVILWQRAYFKAEP